MEKEGGGGGGREQIRILWSIHGNNAEPSGPNGTREEKVGPGKKEEGGRLLKKKGKRALAACGGPVEGGLGSGPADGGGQKDCQDAPSRASCQRGSPRERSEFKVGIFL